MKEEIRYKYFLKLKKQLVFVFSLLICTATFGQTKPVVLAESHKSLLQLHNGRVYAIDLNENDTNDISHWGSADIEALITQISNETPWGSKTVFPVKVSIAIAILIIIGFLINIPFYIKWLKKQPVSSEVFLYAVKGKYTYLNVLDWVYRIERSTGQYLLKEREIIERYFISSLEAGKSIKVFKRKIHTLLKDRVFGAKMVATAIGRMSWYTKLVFFWDILILLSVVNIIVSVMAQDLNIFVASVVGFICGFIPAAPIWLVCHLILNHTLKRCAVKYLNKGNKGAVFRVVMAQFWGASGGFLWKDIYWVEGKSTWISATLNR